MRSCHNEPGRIRTITDDELVNDVLNPLAAFSNNGDQFDLVGNALLNERLERGLVLDWYMQDYP